MLATDLPLVSDALLLALVAWPEADAVLPRAGEGRHALCALFARERVLPVARAAPRRGRARAARAARRSSTRAGSRARISRAWIRDGEALANLNTPEDLARIERSLEAASRSASR